MPRYTRLRSETARLGGPPTHPPPPRTLIQTSTTTAFLSLLAFAVAISGCSTSKALRPALTPEPPARQQGLVGTSTPDSTLDQSLGWTQPLADSTAPQGAGTNLVATARSLYRRGLELYAGGDNQAAAQSLTDAALAVDMAAELDLTDDEAEEMGLLQEKVAFFLDQLTGHDAADSTGEAAAAGSATEIRNDVVLPLPDQNPVKTPEIQLLDNDRVEKWINYFTGRGRDKYQLWLERTGRYRDIIFPILDEEGLPHDLIYLSLIESGMNPKAVSWAQAVGMWQFIKSTARLYDVQMDWWVDERRDPVKSCRAAARHLHDLYVTFDDWMLALAAYNTGAGRVMREIDRCHTRDYWNLRLPSQTRDYIPEFMAAALIGHDPEKYGFNPSYIEPLKFDMVEVQGPLSLAAVAQCAGVSPDELADLNPKLRQGAVPPRPSPYLVRVPPGSGTTCQAAIASLTPEDRQKFAVRQPVEVAERPESHTVRSGETLSGIARRYATSPASLARLNGLRKHDVIRVGMRLRLPENARDERSRKSLETREAPSGTTYVVRSGDTMGEIARRAGIATDDLLRWNNLHANSRIYPGDELVVGRVNLASAAQGKAGRPAAARAAAKSAAKAAAKPAERSYTVRRGDTLYDIAMAFGTTTRSLELANGLHRNELICPGDNLVIPGGDAAKTPTPASVAPDASSAGSEQEVEIADESAFKLVLYTVRAGDTLGKIAAKFGVRLTSLRRWNDLADGSVLIQRGQQLKVYVPQRQAG